MTIRSTLAAFATFGTLDLIPEGAWFKDVSGPLNYYVVKVR